MGLWLYYLLAFFGIILLRYFLVAGSAYWLFYFSSNQLSLKGNYDIKSPSKKLIKNDISLSVITAIASAICATLIMTGYDLGGTLLYKSIEDYGSWYLIVSFFGVILLQDACYYFFHRALHHPLVFDRLHSGHHRSHNPTPWTSFALDFPEALIQGLFLVAVVFVIPLHIMVLVLWLITMTLWSLINHLGFELFPNFPDHWLGKWFISSDHHSLHHRCYSKHYGLYFTFWDRILGTN